mgnify:CR=1 FL=1
MEVSDPKSPSWSDMGLQVRTADPTGAIQLFLSQGVLQIVWQTLIKLQTGEASN